MGDSGAVSRRLFVDAIDEAEKKAEIKANGHKKLGANRRRQLSDIAIRRLRDAEKLARIQRQRLSDPKATADLEFVKSFNELTKTITALIEQIRRSTESERKAMAGLSEARLMDVWRNELPKVSKALADEDWYALLEARFGAEMATALLNPQVEAEDESPPSRDEESQDD